MQLENINCIYCLLSFPIFSSLGHEYLLRKIPTVLFSRYALMHEYKKFKKLNKNSKFKLFLPKTVKSWRRKNNEKYVIYFLKKFTFTHYECFLAVSKHCVLKSNELKADFCALETIPLT